MQWYKLLLFQFQHIIELVGLAWQNCSKMVFHTKNDSLISKNKQKNKFFTGLYHLFWSSHALSGVSHCLRLAKVKLIGHRQIFLNFVLCWSFETPGMVMKSWLVIITLRTARSRVAQWQSSWPDIERPGVQFSDGSWFLHYLNSVCVCSLVLHHKKKKKKKKPSNIYRYQLVICIISNCSL